MEYKGRVYELSMDGDTAWVSLSRAHGGAGLAEFLRVHGGRGPWAIGEWHIQAIDPQPRYVTKNVQDVRVGDVVKAGDSLRGGKVEEVRLRLHTTMLVYTVSQEDFGNSRMLEVEVRD